jgi:Flp pilus assembly protein TadD
MSPRADRRSRGARNALLITVDTLRADAVGAYGNSAARTPHLDRLARAGLRVDTAYATAPITLTSHASMLTGLYPPGHGARHNGISTRADVPTVAEWLRERAFRTAAFVSAFPLDRSFGLARGFHVYSDRMPRGTDGRPANERPGAVVVDEALAWLEQHRSDRFFVWVHLFEPHAPYGDPSAGGTASERYAAEVTEADRQIGRLIDGLRERRDDTLVVVAGDHGEAFGEHGEVSHSIFVYDTTLRVPLVFGGAATRRGSVLTGAVSLVDIVPTLLRALGVAAMDTDGTELALGNGSIERARGIYSESFAPLVDFGWSSLRSLRLGRWKYIAAPRPELYDLENDPEEERNVIEGQPALAAGLAARVGKISGPELATAAVSADPDARRRLQALGYASGSPRAAAAGARRDPKDARALAATIAAVLSGELRGEALDRGLRSILAEDPDNPQASLRLGYLRLEAGTCGEAETLFARAIAGGIAGADAHLGLATCLGRRGDAAGALRSLEQAKTRERQNPVVLANIGIALAALGEHARAAGALRDALAIDPDLHEARFNLALAYARSGDRAAAEREARALLARLPSNAPQRAEVERLLRTLRQS